MVKINKENNLYTVREDGGACDVLFVTTRIADLVAWYRHSGYSTFCAGSDLPGNASRALMAAFTAQATRPTTAIALETLEYTITIQVGGIVEWALRDSTKDVGCDVVNSGEVCSEDAFYQQALPGVPVAWIDDFRQQ